jgi:serine/threonine protein kinase
MGHINLVNLPDVNEQGHPLLSGGNTMDRDRNLLFGVLAVQLRKVTPTQLVDIAGAWAMDPSRCLGDRLLEAKIVSAEDKVLLDGLVDQAINTFGGDASKTLQAFGGEEEIERSFQGSILITDAGVETKPMTGSPIKDVDTIPAVQESPGRYSQISEYGRGGMGKVLLVHDQYLGRDVALKELLLPVSMAKIKDKATPVSMSMQIMARFLQESRITGQLEHPAIVPVYELGHRKDGTLYYTMKLVRGRTLTKAIKEAGSLQGRLALLPHFVDLCQAIAYAHSRGVIHRDIKPDNVMVGEFGETVVLDWGLAKAHNQTDVHSDGLAETLRMMNLGEMGEVAMTAYGHAIGTPSYMPPEQATGQLEQVNERSDIYSLGAILYEILTGHPPFTGQSVQDILNKVLHQEPASIRSFERRAPKELIAMCSKAMSKVPEKRYKTAKEFANAVQGWVPRVKSKVFLFVLGIVLFFVALIQFSPSIMSTITDNKIERLKAKGIPITTKDLSLNVIYDKHKMLPRIGMDNPVVYFESIALNYQYETQGGLQEKCYPWHGLTHNLHRVNRLQWNVTPEDENTIRDVVNKYQVILPRIRDVVKSQPFFENSSRNDALSVGSRMCYEFLVLDSFVKSRDAQWDDVLDDCEALIRISFLFASNNSTNMVSNECLYGSFRAAEILTIVLNEGNYEENRIRRLRSLFAECRDTACRALADNLAKSFCFNSTVFFQYTPFWELASEFHDRMFWLNILEQVGPKLNAPVHEILSTYRPLIPKITYDKQHSSMSSLTSDWMFKDYHFSDWDRWNTLDRNLLFGVLAVQLRKVTPTQLVDIAGAWAMDPSRCLGDRLLEAKIVSPEDKVLLDGLVDQAIKTFDGDASLALESFGGEEEVYHSFRGSVAMTDSGGIKSVAVTKRDEGEVAEAEELGDIPAVEEMPSRYTYVNEYGRGGMGRVLLVHDEVLGRDLALKELLPNLVKDGKDNKLTPVRLAMPLIARFLQEAKITGQLEHPSIVPVYELGHRKDGTLYYTMKLVRGKTLHKAIHECKNLDERLKLLPHFVDLCNAIAYAHKHGVIHRDIKPMNVMIGEFGETVVLDWGLAKIKNRADIHAVAMQETVKALNLGDDALSGKTRHGDILGTPLYMPPEQAKGDLNAIDERSDIYSLGAVLYEILTGNPPFGEQNVMQTIYQVINETPKSIASQERRCPPDLIQFCNKAMEKLPENRYQKAKELADAVEGSKLRPPKSRLKKYLQRAAIFLIVFIPCCTVGLNIKSERDLANLKALYEARGISMAGNFWETATGIPAGEEQPNPNSDPLGAMHALEWQFPEYWERVDVKDWSKIFGYPLSRYSPHVMNLSEEEVDRMRSFVQEHEDVLNQVRVVAQMPRTPVSKGLQNLLGEAKNAWELPTPNLLGLRHCANLLHVHAVVCLHAGDIEGALTACTDIIRFADHLNGSPIPY